MKYYEVDFKIEIPEALFQDACDILSAMAGEVGFETFEQTESGLKGYVQQSVFDEERLKEQLQFFPFDEAHISYELAEAEYRNWNEQWEQEGFEPIVVTNERENAVAVIHDGRHLPPENKRTDLSMRLYSIEIDAHLAFGTGTHQTTRMMVNSLLELNLNEKRILDCGCGTGILGIAAIKMGAYECIGYDIDEWSVDNARHNAVINQVDERFTSLLGDATILQGVDGKFDVVTANINRNILLDDMPVFRNILNERGILLLSGFYKEDIPLLKQKAAALGLRFMGQKDDNNWGCLKFTVS